VLRLLLLACRSSRSKDLELLVLRQELVVLRRQVPHPRTRQEERLVLTVLQRLRPVNKRLSNLFTPDTLRRWHRELVKAKWRLPHRVVSRPRISLETQILVWRMARENNGWLQANPGRTPEDRHRDLDDEHPPYPDNQAPYWPEPGDLAPVHAHPSLLDHRL
jgi:hypothetical protein